jgi:beta-glucanase (GH16 family)
MHRSSPHRKLFPHRPSCMQQWYTNRSDNANVAGGNMILTARKRTSSDGAACPSGKCKYTSARIRTYKKFSINPRDKTGERTVRIETRVRLPKGTGMWPAIQMLPENSPANCSGCGQYGRWPTSGAITIAQAVNNMTDATGGLIYGAPFPQQVSSTWKRKLSTNFYHRFALEWTLQTMRFYIDDKKVFEAYSSQGGTKPNGWFTTTSTRKNAPFDQKFHILINLAVGGFATGASESQVVSTLSSPKYMAIDYVRVCRK